MNEVLIDSRKTLGLTITTAAERIGISHAMLAMLESKKRKGSDATKIKVAKFYKISVQELFYS